MYHGLSSEQTNGVGEPDQWDGSCCRRELQTNEMQGDIKRMGQGVNEMQPKKMRKPDMR